MFEFIILLVVVSVAISRWEERKLKKQINKHGPPTNRSTRHEKQTERDWKLWFWRYKDAVAVALKAAKTNAEIEAELDQDPGLRKGYEELLGKIKAEKSPDSATTQSEPHWIAEGLPQRPAPCSDFTDYDALKARYEVALADHKAFVCGIQAQLHDTPGLIPVFHDMLRTLGCTALIVEFPSPARPRGQAAPRPRTICPDVVLPQRKDARADAIRAEVVKRGIPHLVHFTCCENLPSIFKHGLRSLKTNHDDGLDFVFNDHMRLDGHRDAISLSVAVPNYKMFFKHRQLDRNRDWAVLILSPKILWQLDCSFYRLNAADHRMRTISRDDARTVDAFHSLFEDRGNSRAPWLRPCDPTNPQAEILVFDTISPDMIETVAFETRTVAQKWDRRLGGRDRIYAGPGKGLFGTRQTVRLA